MASTETLKTLVASFKRNVAYYSCPNCGQSNMLAESGVYGPYIKCGNCELTVSDRFVNPGRQQCCKGCGCLEGYRCR